MWKHKNFINLQLCAGEQDELAGTWVFNDTIDTSQFYDISDGSMYYAYEQDPTPPASILVNFNSNNQDFLGIGFSDAGVVTVRAREAYYGQDNPFIGTNKGWVDEAYKTITITSKLSEVTNGNILLTWLQANATKQSTPQPTLTFKHFYDAGTIGTGAFKFRHYSQQEPTPSGYADCLTFTGETSEFTLKATYKSWDGTLEWSTDHTNWTTLTGMTMQSVDKKLYLRGKNTTFRVDSGGVRWKLSARAGCSGNIQTLLDWENPPTVINTDGCYGYMFFDCTNLTTAPELPATTLAEICYYAMFQGCTNLTKAPELPATTLKSNCYSFMFNGCTALKVNISSGNKIFTCPSTIPDYSVNNMFDNTGGTFTGTPTAGTTYYYTE